MTDKVQKIKAEIERFRETNKVSEDKEYAQYELDVKCGYNMALDDMLSFINSLPEEPVSEDLEKVIDKSMPSKYCWSGDGETTLYTREQMVSFFKAGAKWQEKQDQSTIELAEDHAMLAGMEKMKEQMMANATEATIGLPYENKDGKYTQLIDVSRPLPVGNNKIVIIFKED